MYNEVAESAAPIWEQVSADHYDAPTPCDAWDVRALMLHTVTGIDGIAAMLEGAAGNSSPAAPVSDDAVLADPAGTYAAAMKRIAAASDAVDPNAEVFLGPNPMPAVAVATIMMTDAMVHTWDLATALGVDYTMPEGPLEVAYASSKASLTEEGRSDAPDAMFGLEVEVSDDASLQDKYLGWIGRTPRA